MSVVLHLIDTKGPGGAEMIFLNVIERTAQQGFDGIAVIPASGWLADRLAEKMVPLRIVNMKGSFNWKLILELVRIVKASRIELIHAHLFGSSVYAAIVGMLTRTPVVATFHGEVDVVDEGSLGWLKRWVLNRGVSTIVSVSAALQSNLIARGVVAARKAVVIHNGVDVGNYVGPKSTRLRKQLKISDSTLLIGSLGNIRPAKGYDVMVRAMALLDNMGIDFHFVIAGQDKSGKGDELMRLAVALGIGQRISLLGFQQDTAEYLRNLDLFVLSSLSEGFSIATIEALAAGVRVVATRCGGPEEILGDGLVGKLVEPGDAQAIAQAIHAVAGTPFDQKECIDGREIVNKKFSMDAMINQYAEIYRAVTTNMRCAS